MIKSDPTSKICSKCGEEKTFDMFSKHSGCKYGVRSNCKVCEKSYHKNHLQKNNKKINEKRAIFRDENREHVRAQNRAYLEKNRDKVNAQKRVSGKLYREKYPERIRASQQKYVESNRDAINAKDLKRYHDNSEKINKRIKDRLKKDHTFRINNQILGCFYNMKQKKSDMDSNLYFHDICGDIQLYIDHFKNSSEWDNYIKDIPLSIDHIIPSSAYDLKDLNELKKCWDKQNLRLLSLKENGIKHNKIYFDLIEQHGITHLLPDSIKPAQNQKLT